MNRWLQAFRLLVLALWLPCTVHCTLEASGLGFGDCCLEAAGTHSDADVPGDRPSTPCAECSCSSLESGGCLVLEPFPDLVPSLGVLWVLLLPAPSVPRGDPPPPPRGRRPEWRFHERVALMPRAPSRAS